MRTFFVIWLGQLVSLVGSSMTSFGLGVWVYQRTGSATDFALISVAAILPGILALPVAGVFADRYDRRRLMIVSDVCAGLSTLFVALLLFSDSLQIWHIYLSAMVSSTASAFQFPAYTAATSLMVPKEQYGRASGLVSASDGISSILAPALAGVVVAAVGLHGVILIDFITFLFAVSTLLLVRFPSLPPADAAKEEQGSFLENIRFGWRYLTARRGLFSVILFFTALNFTFGFVAVLLTPMLLEFTDTAGLGLVVSAGGIGALVGSVAMSVWGGAKRQMPIVFGYGVIQGIVLIICGWRTNLALIALAQFCLFTTGPIVNGTFRVLMQRKVAPAVQGRVFSIIRMLAWASLPLAYLFAGPLADQFFEPLMQADGALAASLGEWIGVGQGRGIALMYILAGLATLLSTVIIYRYPPARRVESDTPDHDADVPPAAVSVELSLAAEAV